MQRWKSVTFHSWRRWFLLDITEIWKVLRVSSYKMEMGGILSSSTKQPQKDIWQGVGRTCIQKAAKCCQKKWKRHLEMEQYPRFPEEHQWWRSIQFYPERGTNWVKISSHFPARPSCTNVVLHGDLQPALNKKYWKGIIKTDLCFLISKPPKTTESKPGDEARSDTDIRALVGQELASMSLRLQAKQSQPSLFKVARHSGWASYVCRWKPVSTAGLGIVTLSLPGHSEPHNLHDPQCSCPVAMDCPAQRDRHAQYGWTGTVLL